MQVVVDILDADVEGGIRTEIYTEDTGIIIN